MAFKPILFNTEMVRAILEGRKTQTRRIIKLTPGFSGFQVGESGNPYNPIGFMYPCGIKRPPCNPGDILWVRETFCEPYADGKYAYRADYGEHDIVPNTVGYISVSANMLRWHPSIHMPKEAARLFLRVTNIFTERLQEISIQDISAEGVPFEWPMSAVYCPVCKGEGLVAIHNPDSLGHMDIECTACFRPDKRFKNLWNSTIKTEDYCKYGWEANPWVWGIEFERTEKPERWCDV